MPLLDLLHILDGRHAEEKRDIFAVLGSILGAAVPQEGHLCQVDPYAIWEEFGHVSRGAGNARGEGEEIRANGQDWDMQTTSLFCSATVVSRREQGHGRSQPRTS